MIAAHSQIGYQIAHHSSHWTLIRNILNYKCIVSNEAKNENVGCLCWVCSSTWQPYYSSETDSHRWSGLKQAQNRNIQIWCKQFLMCLAESMPYKANSGVTLREWQKCCYIWAWTRTLTDDKMFSVCQRHYGERCAGRLRDVTTMLCMYRSLISVYSDAGQRHWPPLHSCALPQLVCNRLMHLQTISIGEGISHSRLKS